jgi:hypothetical protein
MSERDDEPQDEAATDAPEAAADDTTAEEQVGSEDAQMADTVDERASELTGGPPSPQPEGTVGDPIGDAEQHIASLDMEEERKKVQDLSNKL